jgi:S-layer protein
MGVGDRIEFSNLTLTQTTAGAAVATLGTYAATLTSALAGDGSATPIVKWFTFDGDTYVVADNSVSATFDANVDYVVKVIGVHDLNVAGNISSFTVTLH